ncbi:MAG: hypothetical protein FWG82_02995 [Oscillospiraceae bacterium]|nr:hypothetical protein [Oscillospiraceae bacterium]
MTKGEENFKLKIFYRDNGINLDTIFLDIYKQFALQSNAKSLDKQGVNGVQLSQADE